MLISFVISTLEAALSTVMAHQIVDHTLWHDLYGKPMLLRLEQPHIRLFCILNETSIILREASDNDIVAVSISTDFRTLMASLTGQSSQRNITIQGQAQVAHLLARFIRSFHPDIEGLCAIVVGQSAAYAFTSQLKAAGTTMAKSVQKVYQSSGEYLQHECQVTPSRAELKSFYRGVDQLAGRIDVCQERLQTYFHHQDQTNHAH